MLSLAINYSFNARDAFRDFSDAKLQSRMTNFVLARVGRRYRDHLKKNYLAGQMIDGGRGTDSLSGRMRVYRDKRRKNVYLVGEKKRDQGDGKRIKLANIYEHVGGYVIKPKRKNVLMFVDKDGHWGFAHKIEGRARPFMSASYLSFAWTSIFNEESEIVINNELAKVKLL